MDIHHQARRLGKVVAILLAATAPSGFIAWPAVAETAFTSSAPTMPRTHFRTENVGGVDIFYREAGPADAPVVVLLHGFPTSSNMYRDLIPSLAENYRVIAPDFPGFGQSAMPDRASFDYSFATIASVMDELLTKLGADRYALYVMDYGAPVGFRLALKHPERISALVVQNGNAYDEGLKSFWDPIKAYWIDPSEKNRNALRAGLTLEATRSQYLHGVGDPTRIDPSVWLHDQTLLDREGNDEVQLDLFRDYRTNVALYPEFQQYFRAHKPATLIVWGKNDVIFPPEGAHPYLRDLPDAELHLLDTGHFALEDKGDEIARLMLDFLGRRLPPS